MNDEKTSTEAEQKKPGDLNAGIERMVADLETIGSIIRTTRLLAEGMENGGLKWVTLSKALGNIRHVLGPCAIMPEACFHKVYDFASGTGAFRTPKEIIDFVTANPPIHIPPAAEPAHAPIIAVVNKNTFSAVFQDAKSIVANPELVSILIT